jgi:hypothetical protein
MFSIQLNAQVAYFSDEVKAKMDQNKIDGVPTLSGIEFEHLVTIASGISDRIYKNDDVKINEAINQVKNELGFLHANFERLESGDLLIHFIDDVDNGVDSIKMALTNKNLMASSFEVVAKIVQ